MDENYVLQMQNISKQYDGNPVLTDVSLSVKPGEIYALIGENGAGKSTLMNILFGMSVIAETGGYGGQLMIDGEPCKFECPSDAMDAGIGMVHQEFMLIPGFTVAENIKLAREPSKPTMLSRVFGEQLEPIDREKMNSDSREALATIGMDLDEETLVEGMPVGYMQFIEIAREIDKTNVKLLVFDEPTAVLAESEASRLLEVMQKIAAKGIAIIFITHRLDEVMQVAEDMTVLRDGHVVASKPIADTNVVEIAELMVGRKVETVKTDETAKAHINYDHVVLKVRDLCVDMPGETVKGIDFDVHEGEIFGIGGLAGQGKIGIPNGIRGLFPTTGQVEIFDNAVNFDKLGDALEKGAAFVSEDRRGVGLLLDESIEHNIMFNAMVTNKEYLSNLGFTRLLNVRKMRRHARDMMDILDIRATGPHQKVASLSGGNQQKVCLAGALTLKPKLLVISEPTRGIDIGAKNLIMEYLVKLREEQNLTIVMVSSELVELRSVCDRIAIVSDGVISDILEPDASDAAYGLAMSAVSKKEVS